MLSIKCTFDEELGPCGMDPLGRLVISDGHSEIVIDETYLDTWLAGLIGALDTLRSSDHVSVQAEEPKPIEIVVAEPSRHLIISYDQQRVVASGLKELEFALRVAVTLFLESLRDDPEASQNRDIDPIRRFHTTTHN